MEMPTALVILGVLGTVVAAMVRFTPPRPPVHTSTNGNGTKYATREEIGRLDERLKAMDEKQDAFMARADCHWKVIHDQLRSLPCSPGTCPGGQ